MVTVPTFVIALFGFWCPETGMILLLYLINYLINLIFVNFFEFACCGGNLKNIMHAVGCYLCEICDNNMTDTKLCGGSDKIRDVNEVEFLCYAVGISTVEY